MGSSPVAGKDGKKKKTATVQDPRDSNGNSPDPALVNRKGALEDNGAMAQNYKRTYSSGYVVPSVEPAGHAEQPQPEELPFDDAGNASGYGADTLHVYDQMGVSEDVRDIGLGHARTQSM